MKRSGFFGRNRGKMRSGHSTFWSWRSGRKPSLRLKCRLAVQELEVRTLLATLHPGDILVADLSAFGGQGGIIQVNPVTGEQTTISSGGRFVNPLGIAIAANGDLYVADGGDWRRGEVIRVNPETGEQTLISSGGSLTSPLGIAIAPNGDILTTQNDADVIRINPTTGAQTVVSSWGLFDSPGKIAVAPNSDIFIADWNALSTGAIFRVNPTTGAQTVVSSGQNFPTPTSIALAANGDIFVGDGSCGGESQILRVDPATGIQTVVTKGGNLVGCGYPDGIAIGANGDLFVADDAVRGITRVNAVTGAQTLVSPGGDFVNPYGIAIVPSYFGYVANGGSDFVSVIDTNTNTIVGRIPVGEGQSQIDLSPGGRLAYVTHGANPGDISVIDTATRTVIKVIQVDGQPRSVRVSPRGDQAFVPDHIANRVWVISTDTNTVVGSVSVGTAPEDVIFSPDGSRAYVSNVLSGTVSVIDTSALQVIATVGGVGAGPRDMAILPDGSRIYVETDWNGVSVINTATNSVVATIPLHGNGLGGVAITPDGKKLYVNGHGDGLVHVVDTATNTVMAQIAANGITSQAMAVRPDGAFAYAGTSAILVIDTSTDQVVATLSDGVGPGAIAIGPGMFENQNDPPIADDQGVLLIEDTPAAMTLTATDPEGGAVTFVLVDQPLHGSLSGFDSLTGAVTYTPSANYNGQDHFTFAASDGRATGVPATVYILVDPVNDTPLARSDSSVKTDEDNTVAIDLGKFVQDVETAPDGLTYLINSGPSQGKLSGTGRNLTYIPNADFNGTDSFTYHVIDRGDPDNCGAAGEGCAAAETSTVETITITVNPVNDPPQANDQSVTVSEDGTVVITLVASDVDGDALTYRIVAPCTHGCLDLDSKTGRATYRPELDYFGPDSLKFQASDGLLDSNVATVSITVTALTPGFDLRNGVLTVIGTTGPDNIKLVRTSQGYNVVTNFGTYSVASRSSVSRMVVRARGGNDVVNLSALDAPKTADIYGGDGNDTVTAGAGHDIVLGGLGNDSVTGGDGNDLLIGGAGSDSLVGSNGNDMLFAGVLNDPCSRLDLRGVLNAWNAATTSTTRRQAAQPLIDKVVDDAIQDLLTGGSGVDLFVLHKLDRIIDLTSQDLTVRV